MSPKSQRVARISIDHDALVNNLNKIRELTPDSEVYAVVKADAYGHGMDEVAATLEANGVDGLAVAMMDEALHLRRIGCRLPLMVFHGCRSTEEVQVAVENRIQIIVHHLSQLEWLRSLPSGELRVWLKVETGMHRLGLSSACAERAREMLAEVEGIRIGGIMSHFANADDIANEHNQQQLDAFLAYHGSPSERRSLANSAAICTLPGSHFDIVRPGIMLYGGSPMLDRSAADIGLRPVMQFESQLIAVNQIEVGDVVGYGSTWACPESMQVGIVAAGYADGYPRHASTGTPVWVNGHRTQLLGRVSMDSICIDLRGIEAEPGDRVVLWGREIPVDDVADHAGTIAYELLCAAGNAYR